MKDLRETRLFARYTVTDHDGNHIDGPALLLWASQAIINTTKVRQVTKVVECISDMEETLLYEFDRYASIAVSHFCDIATHREVYQFSTIRYDETHTLTVWIETSVPDFDYTVGHSPSRRL